MIHLTSCSDFLRQTLEKETRRVPNYNIFDEGKKIMKYIRLLQNDILLMQPKCHTNSPSLDVSWIKFFNLKSLLPHVITII
jgi:hypothetical protein